jgi:hypothetical protein
VTRRIYRTVRFLVLAALFGAARLTPALAQTATGEFLCTVPGGGSPDGTACISDDDCGALGVCVIAQPVCNGGTDDGAYCGCIGVSCVAASPACDPSVNGGDGSGVCPSGPNATECCDVTANCADSAPCVGAQKICLSGSLKGVSCLNDDQCFDGTTTAQCGSTGKYCDGGDADGYSCVDDSDCTGTSPTADGSCIGVEVSTPVPTATRTLLATRTATPTRAPGTVAPTATRTPTPIRSGTAVPSATPAPTAPPGTAPRLASAISASQLLIALDDASKLPASGTVQIDDELIDYLGKSNNVLTNVRRGVPPTTAAAHALGSEVFLVSAAPTPSAAPATSGNGGSVYVTGKGSGCSLAAPAGAGGSIGVMVVACVLAALRRQRAR